MKKTLLFTLMMVTTSAAQAAPPDDWLAHPRIKAAKYKKDRDAMVRTLSAIRTKLKTGSQSPTTDLQGLRQLLDEAISETAKAETDAEALARNREDLPQMVDTAASQMARRAASIGDPNLTAGHSAHEAQLQEHAKKIEELLDQTDRVAKDLKAMPGLLRKIRFAVDDLIVSKGLLDETTAILGRRIETPKVQELGRKLGEVLRDIEGMERDLVKPRSDDPPTPPEPKPEPPVEAPVARLVPVPATPRGSSAYRPAPTPAPVVPAVHRHPVPQYQPAGTVTWENIPSGALVRDPVTGQMRRKP